ncbi:MAG: GNAT family N-acetyltransferase [Methylococcales bacterium]
MGKGLCWQFMDSPPSMDLQNEWNRLCENNPYSCASSYPVFTDGSIFLLGNAKIIYAYAYKDKQLICAIPLFLKQKRFCFLNIKVLQIINHDHLDLHVIAGQNLWQINDLVESLFVAIKSKLKGWDYFQARNLYLDKSILNGYRVQFYQKKSAYFNIHNLDSINKVIPKKLLKNINRHQKKIKAEEGNLSLECLKPHDDVITALDKFMDIENSGWKGEANTSISSLNETSEFYTKLWDEYSKLGKAQIYILYLNGASIAGAISFKHETTIYLHKIAYLDSFKAYSPGSILIKMILESAIEKNTISRICLNTNPKWVNRWHPDILMLDAIECFNLTLKGQMLKQLLFLYRSVKTLKAYIKNYK